MKKKGIIIAAVFAAALIGFLAKPGTSTAGVHVDIGFYAPFPGIFVAPPPPPRVVAIPRTEVYYVPGIEREIFFYSGHWYRPHAKGWYRARSHNGPWGYIGANRAPHALRDLPGRYYGSHRYKDQRSDYGRHDRYDKRRWKEDRRHSRYY